MTGWNANPDDDDRRAQAGEEGGAVTTPYEHVVSVSGGKDSTALYLLALERGRPFRAVFADTGNEHEWTYEFVRELPRRTGGPEIQWVRADLSAELARKREFIAKKWPEHGVDQTVVDRAVALLHPTGNPFLDMCLWKTRFPSTKVRFCTEELKIRPMFLEVQRPILLAGRAMISWQGVRAEESLARRGLPRWQRIDPVPYGMKSTDEERAVIERAKAYAYRPLIDWTTAQVFDFHRRHGIPWNPLYDNGFRRVGCMPCIMAKKEEVRAMADRFPAHVEKIEAWEALVTQVNKRGISTFFAIADDPVFDTSSMADSDWSLARNGIRARVEWSRTSRGGRQYDLLLMGDMGTSCSAWGACE